MKEKYEYVYKNTGHLIVMYFIKYFKRVFIFLKK